VETNQNAWKLEGTLCWICYMVRMMNQDFCIIRFTV